MYCTFVCIVTGIEFLDHQNGFCFELSSVLVMDVKSKGRNASDACGVALRLIPRECYPAVAHSHPQGPCEHEGTDATDVHHFLNASSRLMGFEAVRGCLPDVISNGTHGRDLSISCTSVIHSWPYSF